MGATAGLVVCRCTVSETKDATTEPAGEPTGEPADEPTGAAATQEPETPPGETATVAESDTVTILRRDDITFYLVGTAHVSEASVEEVRAVIDEVQPEVVCIELCESRYNTLINEDAWKNLDVFKVIKQGKTLLLFANIILSSYQKAIGEQLGVKPGAEFKAAATAAQAIGARVELVDRNVHITLKRTWANLRFFSKAKLLGMLLGVVQDEGADGEDGDGEITREEIEKLKHQANFSAQLAQLTEFLPGIKKPFIDERDQYMMSSIEEAADGPVCPAPASAAADADADADSDAVSDAADADADADADAVSDAADADADADAGGDADADADADTDTRPVKNVVAVVGAMHVAGMRDTFGKPVDRAPLDIIPPPSPWLRLLKWVIPVLILAAFSYGYFKQRDTTLEDLLYAWILPNSIMAGLLTAIARAKFLSIVTAFIVSPITSLNPLLPAGVVVGLLEAWLRKPTVEDCEHIHEDIQTWKGVIRNPVTHVLLVAVASTMGSALGAWIGLSWLIALIT